MQFEALQVFCDIARCRSFTQAAQANHLSQSAASQIVSQLEERLGVQLIDRSTRPLQLTEPGRVYYEGCKRLIEQYTELEASIRNAESRLASTVQVAAIYSVGLGDMGQYVQRFAERCPEARIHVEYLHPDRVYERVLDGTADLGLVSFPRKSRDLTTLAWREEEMVLACPPGHRLAGQLFVRPAELDGEKFVGFDKHLVIRREVDRFLREQGLQVEVTAEFDNVETIKKGVEVAAGVALLPEPTLRREVQAGTLVAVPLFGCRFVRPLGILHRRQPKPSASALRFVELLRHPDKTPTPTGTESGPFAAGAGAPSRSNGSHRGRATGARGPRRTA
jgi:DNA-binding transcriptional LysR family regulator